MFQVNTFVQSLYYTDGQEICMRDLFYGLVNYFFFSLPTPRKVFLKYVLFLSFFFYTRFVFHSCVYYYYYNYYSASDSGKTNVKLLKTTISWATLNRVPILFSNIPIHKLITYIMGSYSTK